MNCLKCSVFKMLYNFYCQGYNESKLFCFNCKLSFESGISTNKKNITLQSLDESVNFMSNKFDDFNNTISKILNEMKELREGNQEITDRNKNSSKEVNQLKLKIDDLEQKSLEKMNEISKTPLSVEFSPPEKIKSAPEDVTDSVVNYRMVLAPFQKQTQVEFNNIKLKEIAVRFLTIINPVDKLGQFVLPSPGYGIYFDFYEFTLEPYSQCKLSIRWQPCEYGNMRKLIKIEQVNSNKKYDFVILGNCSGPSSKKFKSESITYSKLKSSNMAKSQSKYSKKNMKTNKIKVTVCKEERIPIVDNNSATERICAENRLSLDKPNDQTYLIREKENLPVLKKKLLGRETILTSPEHKIKRPDQKFEERIFHSHFQLRNLNSSSSPMSDDSLETPSNKKTIIDSLMNEFYLTPLRSSENLLSSFNTMNQLSGFDHQLNIDNPDGPLNSTSYSSSFYSNNSLTGAKTYSLENKKLTDMPVNISNNCQKICEDEMIKDRLSFGLYNFNTDSFISSEVDQPSALKEKHIWVASPDSLPTKMTLNGTKAKRRSFSIKNSPYYKYSQKTSMITKNKLKQYSASSGKLCSRNVTLDKYDPELDQEFLYFNNAEDPFMKMSQDYEAEWLNQQECDMIRWLNALLTPTDKLVDEEYSGDLEQAAMAWVEASKMSLKNKPMQFATEKDLFVAQIYRQSPQQWSALRKATTNLMTSSSVTSVMSKLTLSIEKDLIAVRDDRQIHLDLSLKKKIIDLLKCYNPLWLRIGLEAVYSQIILVKVGSNDLDGIGWFIRKNLFNNDFVKQKYTKTTVLHVNLPSYNTAMKKFILRKILMLIYFLDLAKEHKLIRHNPCLFKTNSPYKSSYDLLMGFCADMVIAHGDIVRRMRSIGYNLTHKQVHLDEVNYAVKSLNDLRDGTRITKVVEILFKGNPLSQKLRLPAISKLQKIHNVNLALTRISQHISIEGNICTRDIVNGHREKIISLFWQIIYKYLTPRYNDAATKIQNWWRNSSLKLVILKRIRVKQIAKRYLAAVKIQALIRGYLARKKWPNLQGELIKNREMLHIASTKIKHYLKDKLKVLTEERKRFIILRRTVIYVQKKFRNKMMMVKERQKFLILQQSAVLIQKFVRGFILRKKWPQIKSGLIEEKIRRIAAINIIKRVLRNNLPLTHDRIKFLNLKQTTLYVERLYIANKSMKLQKKYFVLLKKTTVFIQQKFKANIAMKREQNNYLKIQQSVLLIQKLFRGFLIRKNWPYMQKCLMLKQKKRINAINIVKRTLRRNLPKTQDRNKFEKLKNAVLFIQRVWRANKLMKIQNDWYSTSESVFVQKKLRAKIAMRVDRVEHLNKAKQSTVLIQWKYPGLMMKKNWSTINKCMMAENMRRIQATNVIIHALRKNLKPTKDKLYYEKLRHCVILVQQRFRANIAMKIQRELFWYLKCNTIIIQRRFRANVLAKHRREEYLWLKSTVVRLQSMVRGYLFRQLQWPMLRVKLLENRLLLAQHSDTIKRFLRQNLPLTDERTWFLQLRAAAIVLQQRFRAQCMMREQRRKYAETRVLTIGLQSAIRGYLFRRFQWPILCPELIARRQLLIHCVNTIKRALMNYMAKSDRQRFLRLRNATVMVQSKYRARWQAREYQRLRNATILIQQKFRATTAAKWQWHKYNNIRAGVIVLQAYARGYLVRQKWLETKCILQVHRDRLISASNTIKRFLRQCLPIQPERSKYLALRQATIFIQSQFRAVKTARLLRTEFLRLRQSTIILQKQFRAWRTTRALILLQAQIRGYLARQQWPHLKQQLKIEQKLAINALKEKNNAASKIQAAFKGFIIRKKLPILKEQLSAEKQIRAATLIQAFWRGFNVRKKYQCQRETVKPKQGALTLAKRHNDVMDVLIKQKKNEYSFKELARIFWNLDTCTALSKELCVKTVNGPIVDYILNFFETSNQSQPSIAAQEPALRVLINLLRYHETSQLIWMKTVNTDMIKQLIKKMKSNCGKLGTANKVYCLISTWIWIALQDPEKKCYIQNIPVAITDFKFMKDTLYRRNKKYKLDKKVMVLPSTRPTWFIGSKCQKCFESDLFATIQVCKMLNIK